MQQNLYQNQTFQQSLMNSSRPPDVSIWPSGNFSPPVSEAIYVTTATSTWAHTVPPFMPWVPGSCNATSHDPIVRFSAPFPPGPCTSKTATSWELLNNISICKANTNMHLKRRLDSEEPSISPQKQLITDEKMAARMQKLHINNEQPASHEPQPYPCAHNREEASKSINTVQELEVMLSSCNSKGDNTFNKSLVLAPELKSLIDPEKLFAKTFVNEVERPTMAVVLWKPPHGDVEKIVNSSKYLASSDSQNNVNMSTSMTEDSISSSNSREEKSESLRCMPDAVNSMFSANDEDYDMEA